MTKKMFFDTDCFSSFLMIGREDIILTKYRGQIVIPQFVYDEYCRPVVYHLRVKIDQMLAYHLQNGNNPRNGRIKTVPRTHEDTTRRK